MVDHGRKRWRFCFMGICGPKENNLREVFDFVCNSMFHRKAMVYLFKLLNTGLPNQTNFVLRCY